MQSAIETTFAKHFWNVVLFIQIATCQTEVAFEIQHGNDGSRHHFRIAHLALCVFVVMQGFEHVNT
jgi:hypothetical protein